MTTMGPLAGDDATDPSPSAECEVGPAPEPASIPIAYETRSFELRQLILDDGKWHRYAVSMRDGVERRYIDGVQVSGPPPEVYC